MKAAEGIKILCRGPYGAQVFPGYPAEKLKAGDFVHAVNDTPVTAEAAATQLAGKLPVGCGL